MEKGGLGLGERKTMKGGKKNREKWKRQDGNRTETRTRRG